MSLIFNLLKRVASASVNEEGKKKKKKGGDE